MSENKKKFRIIDASTNPATSNNIWKECGEESLIIDSERGGIYKGNGTSQPKKIIVKSDIPTNESVANKADKNHSHGTLTLIGDVSGSVVLSGEYNKNLSIKVKDDSHEHTKFDNMVHFNDNIHLCNYGELNGGAIYFGDDVDVDEEYANVYIKEIEDDQLEIYSRRNIKLSNENGTEILLGEVIEETDDDNFNIVLNAGEHIDYGTGYIYLNCADAYLNNKSIATNESVANKADKNHSHGTLTLTGDVTECSVVLSDSNNKNLYINVKDNSHEHTRFANMVHFNKDIHLCNDGNLSGGAIYFGDNVDEDENAYVYIREQEDDQLEIYGNINIKLSNEKGTEIILGEDSNDVNFNIVLNAGELEDYGTGYIHLNCADAYLNNESIATKYWTNLEINKLLKRIQELEDYIMANIPCPDECIDDDCPDDCPDDDCPDDCPDDDCPDECIEDYCPDEDCPDDCPDDDCPDYCPDDCPDDDCLDDDCPDDCPVDCFQDKDEDGLEDDSEDNCIGDVDDDNFCEIDFDGDNHPDESY